MSQPTITMITAALNPGPEVVQTIESVLSQDYPHVEYLFIDGGSRQEAFAQIEPYRARFAELVREPDEGISDAWNKAIARATGDVVGLINADDYLLPGTLAAVADAYSSYGGSPIVHGGVMRIDRHGTIVRHARIPLWLMFRFGTPIFHPATFVPKVVYDRVGGFRKSYRIAMDYDFLLRAYRADVPFIRVPRPLVAFRGGGLSDRRPLDGFREVRASQLSNGLNRPMVEVIHAAKFCVRKYVRPLLGIGAGRGP